MFGEGGVQGGEEEEGAADGDGVGEDDDVWIFA